MPSARRIGHCKFLGKATLVEPGRIGVDVSTAHQADHRPVHVQSVQRGTDHPALTCFVTYTRARGGASPPPADFLFSFLESGWRRGRVLALSFQPCTLSVGGTAPSAALAYFLALAVAVELGGQHCRQPLAPGGLWPALTCFVTYTRARGGASPPPADFLFSFLEFGWRRGRVLALSFQPCTLSVGGTAPSAALAYFLALAVAVELGGQHCRQPLAPGGLWPALTCFVTYTRARGGASPPPADFLFSFLEFGWRRGRVLALSFQPCTLSVGGTAPSAALAYFLALAVAVELGGQHCRQPLAPGARVNLLCDLHARARRSEPAAGRFSFFFFRIWLAARPCARSKFSAVHLIRWRYGAERRAGLLFGLGRGRRARGSALPPAARTRRAMAFGCPRAPKIASAFNLHLKGPALTCFVTYTRARGGASPPPADFLFSFLESGWRRGRVLALSFQPCTLSVGGTAPSAALAYFLALAVAVELGGQHCRQPLAPGGLWTIGATTVDGLGYTWFGMARAVATAECRCPNNRS